MQIHAEISYVYRVCHLCQPNFSYRGKGRSNQTSTMPWEPYPAESFLWNDQLSWQVYPKPELYPPNSQSASKVTRNWIVPPGAKRHLKRPRTHSHLQMYWFILTQAFLLFLRAMQASMASEQSYFTASLLVMSDLSHMPPGPWTRLRKTTVRLRRKVLPLFLGSPNFTCIFFGRKFTLRTDHKTLMKIFDPDSATPVLAAARLRCCSLLLSSYHYEIEFKSSAEVASADAFSRLSLQCRKDASVLGLDLPWGLSAVKTTPSFCRRNCQGHI